jgi:hypothetical protein
VQNPSGTAAVSAEAAFVDESQSLEKTLCSEESEKAERKPQEKGMLSIHLTVSASQKTCFEIALTRR